MDTYRHFFTYPVLFFNHRDKTRDIFLSLNLGWIVAFWYFFYPVTFNRIFEVSKITTNSIKVTGKNILNAEIFTEDLMDLQFYCIYRVSVRGNRIYENIGVISNKVNLIYFPSRNDCDDFSTKLKQIGTKLNYEDEINLPQIGQDAFKQQFIQFGVLLIGIIFVVIASRDQNSKNT